MKNLSNVIKLRNFVLLPLAFLAMSVFIVGCEKPVMSTGEEVSLFAKAGPIMPEVDIDRLLSAKSNIGIYQVNSGDVLELQMPTIMTAVSPELYRNKQQNVEPYLCRVTDTGTITLPILGGN